MTGWLPSERDEGARSGGAGGGAEEAGRPGRHGAAQGATPSQRRERAQGNVGRAKVHPGPVEDRPPNRLVRPIDRSDKSELRRFEFSDGSKQQNNWQHWLQHDLLGILGSQPSREAHCLTVDGIILAIVVFEVGDDEDSWFINLVAVRHGHQEDGLGGSIMHTCLDMLAERTPGGAVSWIVAKDNVRSQKMSRSTGARPTVALESATDDTFWLEL